MNPAKILRLRGGANLLSATLGDSKIPIRIWDDGCEPLWAYWVACGNFMFIRGIVSADTWEDAYSVCMDEIMDDPDSDMMEEWNRECRDADEVGFPELPEGVLWRGVGEPSCPELHTSFCYAEPMGEQLVPLTLGALREHGIQLEVRL